MPARSALLILVLWIASPLCAQIGPVEVLGTITDQYTRAIIDRGHIVATDRHDPNFIITTELDSTGNYSLMLPYDCSYRIEFFSPGYVPRHVLLDLNGVPLAGRRTGFGLEIDAVLFASLPSVDHSIFEEEPTGICLYDREQKTFVWDMSYILSTKKLVQSTLDRHRSTNEKDH